MFSYRRLYYLLFIPILSVILFSCGKEDEDNSSINFSAQELGYDAGEALVSITSTSAWTIQAESSDLSQWYSLSATSGTGNKIVVLTYHENNNSDPRKLTLTLSTPSHPSITIVQNGYGSTSKGSVRAEAKVGWLELPATDPDDKYAFMTRNMTIVDRNVRNFSQYWDPENMVSIWVAYPLNSSLIGSPMGRSNAWAVDPLLPSEKQPILLSAYKVGNGGSKARGHQIPSADRLGTYERNASTYYGTNMTPQDYDFNAGTWANLESKVRGWAQSSDTLYVVTGCVVEGSKEYSFDNTGKKVAIPTAYFKAVLRYKANSTIGYSNYMGAAFYFNHKEYSTSSKNNIKISKSMSLSIRELEDKLGYDLFVNLPSVVGASTADKIETEKPANVDWWW